MAINSNHIVIKSFTNLYFLSRYIFFPVLKQFSLNVGIVCIADTRQQTNLFFSQSPFGQVRSNAISSWDNLGGFKFTETKLPWMKPTKMEGLDELHFSNPQMPNNVVAHAVHHHDFDGLMPFKGTNTKVLNQGTFLPIYHRT